MSSTDGGGKAAGVPTTIIVKGGTTSSRYDREQARRKDDARRRRAESDRMYQQRAEGRARGDLVRMGESALMDRSNPRIVLHYMDRTVRGMLSGILWKEHIRQDAVCEIIEDTSATHEEIERWHKTHGGKPMILIMVCPRCVSRGVPMGDAQMKIAQRHRMWTLHIKGDIGKGLPGQGEIEVVEYGWAGKEPIVVAGTVSTHDVIKCDNMNCNYAVRIDHSRVFEE
jgi:hypothetical protein